MDRRLLKLLNDLDGSRARARTGRSRAYSKQVASPAGRVDSRVCRRIPARPLAGPPARDRRPMGFQTFSSGRGVRKRRQERQGQACVVVNRSVTCFYAIHAASSDGACADVPRRTLARFRRTTSRAQPAAGGGAAQNAMIELLVITDSVIIYIIVIGDSVPFPYIHERSLNRTWLPMH